IAAKPPAPPPPERAPPDPPTASRPWFRRRDPAVRHRQRPVLMRRGGCARIASAASHSPLGERECSPSVKWYREFIVPAGRAVLVVSQEPKKPTPRAINTA